MEAALAEAGVLAIAAPLLRLAAAQPLAQAVPVAILTAAAGALSLLAEVTLRHSPARLATFRPAPTQGLAVATALPLLLAYAFDLRHAGAIAGYSVACGFAISPSTPSLLHFLLALPPKAPVLSVAASCAVPTLLGAVAAWHLFAAPRRTARTATLAAIAGAACLLPLLAGHHSYEVPALAAMLSAQCAIWFAAGHFLPRSLTVGEAWLVSQGVLLTTAAVTDGLLQSLHLAPSAWPSRWLALALNHHHWDTTTRIVAGSFWGSAVVTVAGCIAVNLPGVRSRHQRFPTRREELWRTGAVLGTILAVSVLVVLPAISRYLRQDVVAWLLHMLIVDGQFFLQSLGATGAAVTIVSLLRARDPHPTRRIIWRKTFHILVVALFLPLLLHAPQLVRTCTAFAMVLFVLGECVRALLLQPLASALEMLTEPFRDNRDVGAVILTPIYLLLGCALPMWVAHAILPRVPIGIVTLPSLAGLLSLGIGDTAAALFGMSFGRTRIPGTVKTMEGCFAGAGSQLVFVAAMNHFGLVAMGNVGWVALTVVLVLNSALEGLTHQIDNLVLPLMTTACLLACY